MKKNWCGRRRGNSSKTKSSRSLKNKTVRAFSRSISCRSSASWDFLARTCMDMVAQECRVWIDDAGIGARGFRVAQFCFGAKRTGDVSDLFVWQRRAEEQVAATFA